MPCNAVATARAQVKQETLRKLLTDELVGSIVLDYLNRRYPHMSAPRQDSVWSSGVAFVMGGYRIHIQDGAVTVTAPGWSSDKPQCAAIANDLTAFLAKAAGLIFQSQVRHAVAMKYGIADEQRANGALVLSVEL